MGTKSSCRHGHTVLGKHVHVVNIILYYIDDYEVFVQRLLIVFVSFIITHDSDIFHFVILMLSAPIFLAPLLSLSCLSYIDTYRTYLHYILLVSLSFTHSLSLPLPSILLQLFSTLFHYHPLPAPWPTDSFLFSSLLFSSLLYSSLLYSSLLFSSLLFSSLLFAVSTIQVDHINRCTSPFPPNLPPPHVCTTVTLFFVHG